jgi:hypothetical protein
MIMQDKNDLELFGDWEDGDDREGLGYSGGVGFTIGYVDEVNGRGSTECPDYRPSRHELAILARHWFRKNYDDATNCWLYAYSGSSESRRLSYSHRRLNRIGAILGEEEMDKIGQEVDAMCRKEWGEEVWEAFLRHDDQWRDNFLDKAGLGGSPMTDDQPAVSRMEGDEERPGPGPHTRAHNPHPGP